MIGALLKSSVLLCTAHHHWHRMWSHIWFESFICVCFTHKAIVWYQKTWYIAYGLYNTFMVSFFHDYDGMFILGWAIPFVFWLYGFLFISPIGTGIFTCALELQWDVLPSCGLELHYLSRGGQNAKAKWIAPSFVKMKKPCKGKQKKWSAD